MGDTCTPVDGGADRSRGWRGFLQVRSRRQRYRFLLVACSMLLVVAAVIMLRNWSAGPLAVAGAADDTSTSATVTAVLSAASTSGAAQPAQSIRPAPSSSRAPERRAGLSIRIVGNHFVDGDGKAVRLLGANRSGTQYACAEQWGIFDGPADDASIASMRRWGFNAVRVNGNEDCWLGINGVPDRYGGANYRAALADYVRRVNAAGMYVILDLHHSAPGTKLASDQQPMPDRDHAPTYWRSVAEQFKHNHAVLFDLYNEPYPDDNQDTTAAWACVRDGGTCPGVGFTAAGMQELVRAVRATGATNPILIGGPQYAGVVDRWLAYQPKDPARQLAASIHVYYQDRANPEWSPCYRQECWERTIAPLARWVHPLGDHVRGVRLPARAGPPGADRPPPARSRAADRGGQNWDPGVGADPRPAECHPLAARPRALGGAQGCPGRLQAVLLVPAPVPRQLRRGGVRPGDAGLRSGGPAAEPAVRDVVSRVPAHRGQRPRVLRAEQGTPDPVQGAAGLRVGSGDPRGARPRSATPGGCAPLVAGHGGRVGPLRRAGAGQGGAAGALAAGRPGAAP